MPTSTVKHVSGPPQPRKTEPERSFTFKPLMQVFNGKGLGLCVRVALFAVCGFVGLANLTSVKAQTLRVRITVTSVAAARIRIDAEFPKAANVFSFRNTYGGVLGLGERIEMLEAIKANGETIAVQKLAPGEFQTSEKVARFKYEVNVTEPSRPAQMSHVSWLNGEQGLLMLADLLPVPTKDSASFTSVQATVDVPGGWTIASNVKKEGSQFLTDEPESTVFLMGPAIREKSQQIGSNSLSIISSGKWPFSDNDALKIARQIISEYSKVTRFDLKRNAVLMLVPFPGEAGPESWSAETRGNDVVLLLGRKASGKRVLSRLGIVLSHELFHLWVPNSLKLVGDYDWFFEGFTLYQALRMDLRLGLISFDNYLETIASVYDSYLSSVDHDRLSLIEASQRRWTSPSSLVYEKGMLAAFIYDLSLRSLTECQASLDDVYSELFRLPLTGQENANEIIIRLLTEQPGLESFAKDYVESAGKINLDAEVSAYGIRVQSGGSGTRLVPGRDLNKAQRKLLGCIGYRH
jgi:predicted metalloprotease with PDZ domain